MVGEAVSRFSEAHDKPSPDAPPRPRQGVSSRGIVGTGGALELGVFCSCGASLLIEDGDHELARGLVDIWRTAHSTGGHDEVPPSTWRLKRARERRIYEAAWDAPPAPIER